MSQRTHVVTDKVQQLYPEAPVLRAVGAQAYVGQQLCNADGEVVGIVTAILNPTQARTFIGIGFAVPIENAASAVGMPPF